MLMSVTWLCQSIMLRENDAKCQQQMAARAGMVADQGIVD